MRSPIIKLASIFSFTLALLTSCKKDDVSIPPTPPTNDPEAYFKVKIRAAITVGDVVYDSIPASFKIMSWDKEGRIHQKDVLLAAGSNEVLLPKTHSRYQFVMNKWGSTGTLSLSNTDLSEATVYTVNANKAAKKLKELVEYSYANGAYHAFAKQRFFYDNIGRLEKVEYHGAYYSNNVETFEHRASELFSYNGNQLEKIEEVRLRDDGNLNAPLQQTFIYNTAGKIAKTQYSYPAESYSYRNDYSRENDIEVVDIFAEGLAVPTTTTHRIKLSGGNRIESRSIVEGSAYGNTFAFDANINPFVHMNWQQTFYNYQSKNNVTTETFFSGNNRYESAKYAYQIDGDGYPTEVVKQERSQAMGAFQATFKKTFIYY